MQFIKLFHNLLFVCIFLVQHRKHCPHLNAPFPTILIEKDNVWKHFGIFVLENMVPVI